jgi:NAD(P)-dependent dehydrogenase (short-subunit alcohol dehydrogenase family)
VATSPSRLQRWMEPGRAIDAEIVAAAALLSAVLVVGLATTADYGLTVDEFNTDDYGPKALAWYTSGFVDRSHFETVEFSLWYYGPWFQMLTAYIQSFDLADRVTVRHAMTFLVGLAAVAALLPIGRLAGGRWAGLAAIALCLMTGYFYGSLFFTPIDVPFVAAMTWATLAILVMTRQVLPSWRASIAAGLLTGLAVATRTGGLITHAYLLGALLLCAAEFFATHGRLTPRYLAAIAARYGAVVGIASITAFALWPWLQIGNPFEQFKIALVHFATIPMSFEFPHWGGQISTSALPISYIPAQLLARLPEAFLVLLAVAFIHALPRLVSAD